MTPQRAIAEKIGAVTRKVKSQPFTGTGALPPRHKPATITFDPKYLQTKGPPASCRIMHWSRRSTPASVRSASTNTGSSRCRTHMRSSWHGRTSTTLSDPTAPWIIALHGKVGPNHPMLKPQLRESTQKVNPELDPGWGQAQGGNSTNYFLDHVWGFRS
jgi:hypothetical protein